MTCFNVLATVISFLLFTVINAQRYERMAPPPTVRLAGSSVPGEGRLEIIYNGTWGTVCDDYFDNNDNAARVACYMLGYGRVGRVIRNQYGPGSGQIWLDDVLCNGTEYGLDACRHRAWGSHDCQHIEDVSISCNPTVSPPVQATTAMAVPAVTVRLAGSSVSGEGRLEVYYNGLWGTVCDDSFDNNDAAVACYMLGFGRAGLVKSNYYGPGVGQIWLDELRCVGSETSLASCPHNVWGSHDCSHSEDVSISCITSTFTPTKMTTAAAATLFSRVSCQLDLVFILDSSGSVGSANFNSMLAFVNNIVGRMSVGVNTTHVAVIVFSSTASVAFNLSRHSTAAAVQAAVSSIGYIGGGTSFYSGLSLASSNVFTAANGVRPSAIKVAILVTDGQDSDVAAVNAAQQMRNAGIRVMAVGVGSAVSYSNLLAIVGIANNYFNAIDFTQLSNTLASTISTESCNPVPATNAVTSTAAALSVRLAGSSISGEGRLEVLYNGIWGTVCDDNFDNNDAVVACYMLGYGRRGFMKNNYYGPGVGQIWLDEVGCVGSETSLAACSHRAWGSHDCSHSEDVSISCLTSTSVPTNMTSITSSPRVSCQLDLVFILDSSGSVGSANFNSMLAFVNNIVGRMSIGVNTTHVAVIVFSDTASVAFNLSRHSTAAAVQAAVSSISYIGGGTSFYRGLSLASSNVFTAANGARPSAIKVAILVTDGQDSDVAAVNAAQQMRNAGIRVMAVGVGSAVSYSNLLAIVGTANNYFNAIDFAQLSNTLASTISTESCNPVTFTTTTSSTMVRLAGGSIAREGRLEVYYNGVWGTVCDDNFDNNDAAVACYMLGFGRTGVMRNNVFGPGVGQIWLDEVGCFGTETSIASCSHNAWGTNDCSHSEDVSISCISSTSTSSTTISPPVLVRLAGSSVAGEGRLEVLYNGVWGTVCDDSFSNYGAQVACYMLGYGRRGQMINNYYGAGTGQIWLDDVICSGSELSIAACAHTAWGIHNCGHYEDVSISCNNVSTTSTTTMSTTTTTVPPRTVRLVGSSVAGEGRLEVYYNGVWGTVCDDNFDNNDAAVACYMLGYGRTGQLKYNYYGPGVGQIWLDEVGCAGWETSLATCAHNTWGSHDCCHKEDVSISCTSANGTRWSP